MERTDGMDIDAATCTPILIAVLCRYQLFCQSISQASQATDRVGEQLQAHQEETAASYKIQLVTAKNAEQLASALGNLTSTAQAELQQISNATHNIRENLSISQGQGARIWYSILLNAFRVIGKGMFHRARSLRSLIRWLAGDLPAYDQVSANPIFRIAMITGHVAWSTIWFLLSAMMVMISSELICLLTQLLERVITPVEAFIFKPREILRKH